MYPGRLHWFCVRNDFKFITIAAKRYKHVSSTFLSQVTRNTIHAISKTHLQELTYTLRLTLLGSNATNGTFGVKDYFAANSLVNVSVNAQDDIAVNTSQSLANLLTGHFNDTCPLGSSQKRLGKRTVTDADVDCVSNSVFSLARFVATNPAVQNDISSVPSNFNVQGQLIRVVNQVKARIQQQPQFFSGRVFSPGAIVSTLAYLTSLAYIIWKYGSGTEITQIVIPYVDVAASASDSPSSCSSSWTFSFTSPTPSTTVVVSQNPHWTSLGSDTLLAGPPLPDHPDGSPLCGA